VNAESSVSKKVQYASQNTESDFDEEEESSTSEFDSRKGKKGSKKRKRDDDYKSASEAENTSDEQDEVDDDDDDRIDESKPMKRTVIPLPKLRDEGRISYDDGKLHENTLLFLKDLKKNNNRTWMKCELKVSN
jgi:hypothetical protein